jgi:hypothetical protein
VTEQSELLCNPEQSHQSLIVIDFDRVLCDVNRAMARLAWVTDQLPELFSISSSELLKAQKDAEQQSSSFNPIDYLLANIKDCNPEKALNFLAKVFNSLSDQPILFPDAVAFLERIRDLPHLVLSSGNPWWQQLKIKASNYQGRYLIIDHSRKGAELASWVNTGSIHGSSFTIPILSGKMTPRLSLIDDKLVAFENLPSTAQGYWLVRDGQATNRRQTPEKVIKIISLDQLVVSNGKLLVAKEVMRP